MVAGRVVWITGLSGAGKSTLAAAVTKLLRQGGATVVLLDGDEMRAIFDAHDYGRDGRLALALRYARLCRLLAEQGCTVVIATISLFKEVHAWNRAQLPGYFEVYLKVPVEELRHRDPKGMYRRFAAGEVAQIAGLDLAIDEPVAADWTPDFSPRRQPDSLADELMKKLCETGV